MTGKLVVLRGERPGTEFNLMGGRAVVGRAEFADIVIVDRAASRQHFEIIQDPGGFTIRDLNSGNGTFLNGQRIREAELVSGDRIQVGTHELNFLQLAGAHRDINQRRIVPVAAPPSAQPPQPAAVEPRQVGPAVKLNVPRAGAGAGAPPTPSAPSFPMGPVAPPPGYPNPPAAPVPAPLPAVRPGGPRRRTSPVTIIAILAFSLIALGLAAVIGWQLYERAKTAEPTPEEIAAGYVRQGDEAIVLLDLDGAAAHYQSALQVQPGNGDASAGLARTRIEARWAALMDEVEVQLGAGQFARALITLRDVQGGSELYRPVASERISALVATTLERTRAAIDGRDLLGASELVRVALDAEPTNPTALAMLDEINALRDRLPQGTGAGTAGAMNAGMAVVTSSVAPSPPRPASASPGSVGASSPPVEARDEGGRSATDRARAPEPEVARAEPAPTPQRAEPEPEPEREREAPAPAAEAPPTPAVAAAEPPASSGRTASAGGGDGFRSTAPAPSAPAIQPFDEPGASAGAEPEAEAAAAREEPVAAAEPRTSSRSRDDDDDDDGQRSFNRGWRYYNSGRFDDAMSFFAREASSGSGDHADEARAYAGFIDEFRTSWDSGRSAYDDGEYDLAVRDLRLALRRDSRLNEHYQGEIRGMLAESYYRLAQADYDRERFEDAGRRAQAALGYDSNHGEARRLLRELDDVANRLYIQARGYRDSDPERARQLCRDIQQMLPQSSDFYQRATELLENL